MRGLVYMASRDKVDVDTFHKDIQYTLEKLGKSKFGFERTAVSNFKSKRHEDSGNELVDYSRAPCLGADQKARGLLERDWRKKSPDNLHAHAQNAAIFPSKSGEKPYLEVFSRFGLWRDFLNDTFYTSKNFCIQID